MGAKVLNLHITLGQRYNARHNPAIDIADSRRYRRLRRQKQRQRPGINPGADGHLVEAPPAAEDVAAGDDH